MKIKVLFRGNAPYIRLINANESYGSDYSLGIKFNNITINDKAKIRKLIWRLLFSIDTKTNDKTQIVNKLKERLNSEIMNRL